MEKIMTKKCIHRQDETHHPNCFRKPQWYKDLRLGYLDIEASGLSANQAWMLSWAIKPNDSDKVVYQYVTPEEIMPKVGKLNQSYDFRITQALVEEMKQYDGLITYYGTGFDLKFIRTRAMKYNLPFPRYGDIGHVDLYYHTRNRMSLNRNSLFQATQHLEIAGKTKLDFSYWGLAAMGDRASMKALIKHNVADVVILEGLHKRLEPYCKFNRNSI